MKRLVLAMLLAGCSSKPVAPTITSVDAPMTSSAGQKITLTVQFDDPDDGVISIRVGFPSTMQSVDTPLSRVVFAGDPIPVGITFPNSTPPGPFEIDLSVTDQSGLQSPTDMVIVTIQ